MLPIRYSQDLPIHAKRLEILDALRAHPVLILAGDTGSGKSTQLPKFCLEAGLATHGQIGCTQPRRVAALSLSKRVAEELAVPWGREVGCKMRFQDDTSPLTRIKFMTDGILLAEIQSDPLLRAYSALILDEAHERSLNIDFLLGYLKRLRRERQDLKLVITSATIDTQAFSEAFENAPILEVSGRLFPVEIRYAPPESFLPPSETTAPLQAPPLSHLQAAARASEGALRSSHSGDVLLFLPTERDIRETIDLLQGSLGSSTEILPLYGRMSAADQQRIFSPGPRRRVIVATNVAETSLTLPRIRYVIDSGLARLSRYNPRTRTKRLPVEEISQSSANQRTGRAGRLQDGICIRLYSEENFQKRPRFTPPEIQRANLAEVILRMKAFGLGEIEAFDFLSPPTASAIRAGYRLLHELGALDDTHHLTPLGKELARLPVDPTLGRMLLQARSENALPEILIIASGLSIPDPRERPEDQREAADAAHRAFHDPDSDFLSLLHLWKASPHAEALSSSNALRRFCKSHFLSFTRMREWRDLHDQLAEAMRDLLPRRPSKPPTAPAPPTARPEASYTAIHRAILSGLLSQIAQKSERNQYKAAGTRLVQLFPGSNLFERAPKHPRSSKNAPQKPEKSRQPEWIVSGEIVETSQLFARTNAGIRPDWIVELAPHLCSYRHIAPHWNAKSQRVLVSERIMVLGLEVARRSVDYGPIDPLAATELFIRGALVQAEGRIPHPFFAHNQELRQKLETALTRVRSGRVLDLEEALFRFYSTRITPPVSSLHDLNAFLKTPPALHPSFLCATEADLLGTEDSSYDPSLFPDQVPLGNTALPLSYAFSPGEEEDGVTVQVPLPLASQLSQAQLQWMIPGLREEQIALLLRALPKHVRKTLLPLEPKITEIAREFSPAHSDFLISLADFITRKYRIHVRAADWPEFALPDHLHPRVQFIDQQKQPLVSGRNIAQLQSHLEQSQTGFPTRAWEAAARRWEKHGLKEWSFGDLPESILVEEIQGAPLMAYPGLQREGATVSIRLFQKAADATAASLVGIRRLAEQTLTQDLAYVRKELTAIGRKVLPTLSPSKTASPSFPAVSFQSFSQLTSASSHPQTFSLPLPEFERAAFENLLLHALTPTPPFPLHAVSFRQFTQSARTALPTLVFQLGQWIEALLTLRNTLAASSKRHPTLSEDLHRILPPDFLEKTPYSRLPHLVRYLKALQIRAERAALHPAKDAERSKQLVPYQNWQKRVPAERHEEFRWLLEEFHVSLFAQELGTHQPVSAQRLHALAGWSL